jgi:hypothetical protein
MRKITQTTSFSLAYGERVRVRPPHPDAGATGQVLNAYLYANGTQIVFVGVPGGQGRYDVSELESLGEPELDD